MTLLEMTEVSRLYQAAQQCTWNRLLVDDPSVRAFYVSLRRFSRSLGDEAVDPYWKPVLRRLRRVRFENAAVPLPLSHSARDLAAIARELRAQLRTCSALYPRYESAATKLVELVDEMSRSDADPLGDAISLVLQEAGFHNLRDAVLLRARGFGEAVRLHLRERGVRVKALTPEELTGKMAANSLLAIGPSAWFPAHVASAPRCNELIFVHYRWVSDDRAEGGLLAGIATTPQKIGLHRSSLSPDLDEGIGATELLPVVDWSGIASKGPTSELGSGDDEIVSANLFLLAGGNAVYLEAEDPYQVYGFDLAADIDDRVRRFQTSRVQPGMYLILRRGGGGDYIPVIADRILRDDAPRMRNLQRLWKDRLRAEVLSRGSGGVVRDLQQLGGTRRSEMNVRYWCSYASIATGKFADFLAIMRLVDLEDRAEELWEAMNHIKRAHLAAGQHVRRLLEERIEKADLTELVEKGMMEFSLEEGGGALSVFRVEAKAPEPFRVSRGQLRHPFEVGRDHWHA